MYNKITNVRVLNSYISVDCVIFGYNGQELQVLLLDRTLTDEETGKSEFTDLTLTGNHIYEDETIEQAAYRVLFDLTGLKNVFLDQFKTFAHPDRLKKENDRKWLLHDGRDPDKRIVSIGYFALIATQSITLEWKGRNADGFAMAGGLYILKLSTKNGTITRVIEYNR